MLNDMTPLWNCIHPCAFICYMIQQGHLPANDHQVLNTLDAYGYLTPDKQIDFDAMNRDFTRTGNAN